MSHGITKEELRSTMLADVSLCEETLELALPEMQILIRSNSMQLLNILRHYFQHIVSPIKSTSSVNDGIAIEVVAIESPVINLDLPLHDWSREAGKRGKKDAYLDLDDGRCIYKVRTGMTFLQSLQHRIAAGPCITNSNQVINFINNQYINLLQQRGYLICHAAALAENNRAIAIAGFSGGGKSTTMLHLMSDPRFDYVTNDRLFIRADEEGMCARGIPKLPRVNPGTLLHNPQLKEILPQERIAELQDIPQQALWNLEEKYDVDIAAVYGESRFSAEPELAHFLILNWSHDSQVQTQVTEVNLAERSELLDAIMKSSGPFYQYADGSFYRDHTHLNRDAYICMLAGVHVYEVSGRVDFECVQQFCLQQLCEISPSYNTVTKSASETVRVDDGPKIRYPV
ncbi:HprK-related kinase B [Mariprofundus sp. EBB-1]|uniref:HprK-related kinase B n=1 Tax=Mariprofundus sp. EBB-1 TaxID=2650971 RepID=UPI000EF21316|nr:HprK-related kinase B [Mariprofundus sp. EBB-1]RLL51891.1 HprK-related kinase B [Mariprofundus sp. EBB-1]